MPRRKGGRPKTQRQAAVWSRAASVGGKASAKKHRWPIVLRGTKFKS